MSPRVVPDPKPALVLGAVGSFAFGFVTVAAVLAAGFALARRWLP